MSKTTLRYYETTLSYTSRQRHMRLKEMKQRFKTRISRRRAKQQLYHILSKLHLGD